VGKFNMLDAAESSISNQLIEAYKATDFMVCNEGKQFVLNIDKYSEELDKLQQDYKTTSSAYITACNPNSQKLAEKQNNERQDSLLLDINKLGCLTLNGTGYNPDKEWSKVATFKIKKVM